MASQEPVAIITGAAQGIGRRTAEILADQGYALALNDLKPPDDVARDLRKRGSPVLALGGDVSSDRDVERIHGQVIENFGRADVLVNNAGISSIVPALDLDIAEWRRVMD